jgi:iron complex transport system ATP-binding protein
MSTLQLESVTVTASHATLLDGVSLSMGAGEFVALVGPNGAGKTSLIRTALGLTPLSSGSVQLGGKPVASLSGRERAAMAAWLPQHSAITEDLTALELVAAARYRFHESRASALDASRNALMKAGAAEFEARIVTRLSGGEQQRVAFACLLAQEAPLLLLDEPANHLDPAQQIALYTLIGQMWRDGHAILCITHDVNLLSFATRGREHECRVLGLSKGAFAFESRLDAPGLGASLSKLFGVQLDAVSHSGRRVFLAASETR